ncbi:ATP-binding cassette domain-containing protein [Nocardia yunnanensis]|uniref:ATP-binding cassette domain-containing protein n=1 Tax=Nocardia yunnanensis TaxID=2382165 RepID=A0A386Z875_9NOCA|nr:ATP-binding cassette domain-containing protein [Nocardia yunnanensis]AYF73806.1 ATP-binding cassette domain-containing protein [Nocardia yunnanensis]
MTMIEVRALSKEYGRTRAVDDVTFDVLPGRVTGFLGPNGAGKSTTMRLVLGLDRPTSGTATVGGHRYTAAAQPLRLVGALLDPAAAHPGRTARDHLLALAVGSGLPARRVDEVLTEVGLISVARKRIRTFSLGMRQRLGIAAALLGDPPVLMLDEPSNGLDPEGIVWLRETLRRLAREGRTVLVSSHLMGETASFADHLLVLGRGRVLADTGLREFIGAHTQPRVRVRTTNPALLRATLACNGIEPVPDGPDRWLIPGEQADRLGPLLSGAGVPILELTDEETTLEHAYLALTAGEGAHAARAKEAA